MSGLVLDLFAGPGGWDEGARHAGFAGPIVGIEWDRDACRTAVAAGHLRVQADVARYPTGPFIGRTDGVIASPVCPTFSTAGNGAGKVDMDKVHDRIRAYANGRTPAVVKWQDERSQLTAEPMRFAYDIRPRWIALEQVPPVLPLWQHMAMLLRGLGYRTWTGVLSAEEYGVPQTRKRAVLVARLDGPVGPPEPTHQAYVSGRPAQSDDDLFGSPLPTPVSMANALGWNDPNVEFRNNTQVNSSTRRMDQPAGTVFFGQRANAVDWVQRSNYTAGGDPTTRVGHHPHEPSSTLTGKPPSWARARPSTTVCGDARIGRPGRKDRDQSEAQFAKDAVRVSVVEAGVLQSFPVDYPWQGNSTKRYLQVGNAVPPLLAAAVLRPLLAPAVSQRAA